MGCDIHGYCEVRENGKWTMVGGFKDEYEPGGYGYEPYSGRNYSLFGLLAGVRNTSIKPIAEPRGVPHDCSQDYRDKVESWKGDGHNHSFLTLDELLMVDQGKMVDVSGQITENVYRDLKEKHKIPEIYCGGRWGPKLFVLNATQMDKVLENRKEFIDHNMLGLLEKANKSWQESYPTCPAAANALRELEEFKNGSADYDKYEFDIHCTWQNLLGECVDSYFFHTSVPNMISKSPSGDPADVRYVFFFDN